MLNFYYPGSHISEKKFERLVEALIAGKKISEAAVQESTQEKTVRNIFIKIRRRFEEDCWRRLNPFYNLIRRGEFPYVIARRELSIKNFDFADSTSNYVPVPTIVFFNDLTVATNILIVSRARLESGSPPISQPEIKTDEALINRTTLTSEYTMGVYFSDLEFRKKSELCFQADKYKKDFMEIFLLYLRVQTFQTHRRDSDKFFLHLKELEWRFNNSDPEKRYLYLKQLRDSAKSKKRKSTGLDTIEKSLRRSKVKPITEDLVEKTLSLIRKHPLSDECSIGENIFHC